MIILRINSTMSVYQSIRLARMSVFLRCFLPLTLSLIRSNRSRMKLIGQIHEQNTLPNISARVMGIAIATNEGRYRFFVTRTLSSPSGEETNQRLPMPRDRYQH